MNSKELKKIFGSKVRVSSINSVRNGKKYVAYIRVWNPEGFALSLRQNALKAVYGMDCSFAESGSAGNVHTNLIALSPDKWAKTLEMGMNSNLN